MHKIINLSFFAFALVSALSGCGQNTEPDISKEKKEVSETKAGENASAAQAFENEKKVESLKNIADKNIPLANYTEIDNSDQDNEWLTYVAVAQGTQDLSDEELLNMFSGRYYNEPDAFKKREIAPLELPRIKDSVSKYKAQKYYSISFGNESDKNSISPSNQLGSYNFDIKAFELGSGSCFGGMAWQNRQRVTFSPNTKEKEICSFKVEDIELAKTIENLRSKDNANVRGIFYFYVTDIKDGNSVNAVVTHVQYDIYDKPHYLKGGKLIATYKY